MNILWPQFLPLLLLVPFMIGLYIWLLRRRRRFAVRYSSISLIREALPKYSRWRQHLPFALFMAAIASLAFATTRPAAEVEVPLSRTSIILALDVSRSMCAVDVPPNRLTVAQEAALGFIEDQADGTQIGIVAFAGFAQIVVPPTTDKEVLTQAVANFTTSFGTAIGSATLESVDAIAAINSSVAFSGVDLSEVESAFGADEYVPDIIVLLTDGANSQGPNPLFAAEVAAERGVRVYTIGFGTTELGDLVCTSAQLGSDAFGPGFSGFGGGFGGASPSDFRQFIVIDEPTLQGIAETTGGEYYRAENAEQLVEVFNNLPTQIVLQKEDLELSVLFTALGAVFALGAVTLSLLWNRYP